MSLDIEVLHHDLADLKQEVSTLKSLVSTTNSLLAAHHEQTPAVVPQSSCGADAVQQQAVDKLEIPLLFADIVDLIPKPRRAVEPQSAIELDLLEEDKDSIMDSL